MSSIVSRKYSIPARLWAALIALSATLAVPTPALADTTDATATATALRPLSILNITSLEFGGIIPGGANSRITVSATTDARVVVNGPAILVNPSGHAAQFLSYGGPNFLTIIQRPANITLTRQSGTETMLIDATTLNGPAFRLFPPEGLIDIRIGGRLNVGANQAPGRYTGTFNVTITYF